MTAKKPAKKSRRAKKARPRVKFLHKPSCTTCRKARSYMEKRGWGMEFRDLGKERLSSEELEKLIGDRDHTEFLNTRNELYRRRNMKENAPSRKNARHLAAAVPNMMGR